MCGLNGAYAYAPDAPRVSREELLRTRERMAARGPDGAGLWCSHDERVGLGHRRLAILDLSAQGAQPMSSADGRQVIVFNGEIYNFRALRAELEAAGEGFASDSDTEVLLALYRRHGTAMCAQLRGMYAFAIWDADQQSLLIARDPLGIKPLYLHDDGATLRFASQVKARLAGGAIASAPEAAGHVGYWMWGHVPEPWTLHRGITSLEPGTWLLITPRRRTRGRFASVADLLTARDALGEEQMPLREALLDSVRHHLVSDVPVGVFLSAGIDSATLATLAAECGGRLRTVTLGFEEYRGTADDETPLAEQVAQRLGATHDTVIIGPRDFEAALSELLEAMDQPSVDGLNTWLVARAASQLGLKVALSGLGGDEFFGGYPAFRQLPRMRALARPFGAAPALGRGVRRMLAPLMGAAGPVKFASLFEYGGSWEGAYLLRRAMRLPWELAQDPGHDPQFVAEGLEKLTAQQQPDRELESLGADDLIVTTLEATRYMRSQLLRDADWAGMAHALEIRVPLVDAPLTRALGARRRQKLRNTKQDLVACAMPTLPEALVHRPKTGFTTPLRDWLTQGAHRKSQPRGLRGWQRTVAEAFAA